MTESNIPLYRAHLLELTYRIGSIFLSWRRTSIVLFSYRDALIQLRLTPLSQTDRRLSWLDPTELMVLGVSRTSIISFVLIYPLIMRHVWLFFVPGMREDEAHIMKGHMFSRLCAMYIGVYMGTEFRVPISWNFFNEFSEGISNVDAHPRISLYFEWYLRWVVSTVCRAHVPRIVHGLIHSNIITVHQFMAGRRYTVVLSFLIGARITPPDMFSQVIVARALVFMFECITVYHVIVYEMTDHSPVTPVVPVVPVVPVIAPSS